MSQTNESLGSSRAKFRHGATLRGDPRCMSNLIQTDVPGTAGFHANAASWSAPEALEGRYRGERVVQLDTQTSLLQDAAEELTFQFGEGEEKTLAKREIGEKEKKPGAEIGTVQQVLGKLGDLKKSVLDRVLQILMMRMRMGDALDLRYQVRQQLPEPGHQYAALLALGEQLREQGAPAAQLEVVAAALRELEQDEGPAIRAALNISQTAAEFAGAALGDVQGLRNTYRDAVLDSQDLGQTLNHLIERYGDAQLPQSLAYLIKALGADLAADGASIDRNKLHTALNDLYRLEVLTGLLEDCAALVQRYQAPGNFFRGSELLREVLDWQRSPWLRPELIAALPGKLGVREVGAEINVLREFKELARMIPLKAYAEAEQRPRLLETIQQALDAAIEREEEAE